MDRGRKEGCGARTSGVYSSIKQSAQLCLMVDESLGYRLGIRYLLGSLGSAQVQRQMRCVPAYGSRRDSDLYRYVSI